MNVRPYARVFQMMIQQHAAYRTNLLFEVGAQVVISFFIVLIWKYISGGRAVGEFTEGALLTYLLVSGFIVSSIHVASSGDYINDDIKDGHLSFYIIKPWSVLWNFVALSAAPRIILCIASFIGYGLLCIGFGVSLMEITLQGVLMSLPFLLCALVIYHLLFTGLAMLAFWLDQTWGPRLLMRVCLEIGAGTLIPLSMLHPSVRTLFEWLPFRFLGDAPVLAMMGRLSATEYRELLLLGIGWIISLSAVYLVIWNKGSHSYEAVGN